MKITKSFDSLLVMKDAGLVAASAAATVSSAAKIYDLGLGDAECDMVIDVSACEVASRDESFRIAVQISEDSDFGGNVYEVASIQIGAADYDFVNSVNRLSDYTLTYDTPVDGLVTPTAGIAAISNATGALGTLTGATVPALPSGTYGIDISADGTNRKLAVALLVTDDWDGIATKLQAALRTASSALETIAITGGKILVTSATTGVLSKIIIATGTTKTATTIAGDVDMGVGRYIINFKNSIAENVIKRYVRIYTHVSGTIASGVNFKAYLARKN